MVSPPTAFSDLDLIATLKASLVEQGFVTPTEIQQRALPALLSGRSVVGVAETGGGKTLAYVLPVLHSLKSLEDRGEAVTADAKPRAIVVVPTRELGEQVTRVFKRFTHSTRLRVRSVLGGTTMEVARRNIQGVFEVLVATPGRLIKLLDRTLVDLGDVRVLVFDEVDQMLDPGFLPDAERIVGACPPNRQLAMFSATVPPAVQDLIGRLFSDAEVIRSGGSHRVVPSLTTVNRTVIAGKRLPILRTLLADKVTGGTLIFVNTRGQCDQVAKDLREMGRDCVVYRGEMDKVERRANLKAFRDGTVDLLVSTDLAARGLDVEHVGRVINYHLPEQLDAYLHRVGRTARAGRPGVVINLVTERDAALMNELERAGAAPRERPRR
jgi:superfamily II DNA/RNA helicase